MLIDSPDRNHLLPSLAQLQRLPHNRPLWLSYTIPWQDTDFLALLKTVAERPRFYWESSAHPVSLTGWGKAAVLTDWGVRRFHDLQAQVEHFSTRFLALNPEAPLDAGPRWMGGFSFLPLTSEDRLWQAFPDAYFLLPRVQLARVAGQVWLTINHLVNPAPDPTALLNFFEIAIKEVFSLQFQAASNSATPPSSPVRLSVTLSIQDWEQMVQDALQRIHQGEFRKVVLARTLRAEFPQPAPVIDILENLSERYPDCYRFLVEPQADQVFLGASPELLASVQAPVFDTTALAGTIRRGLTPQEDEQLGRYLLMNAKDGQEHAIVVQAIQENLAPLAEALEVAPQPTLRKLGNLMHLETPIHGRLRRGWGVLDVVAALHPTPALGGWPRQTAQDFLSRAEPFERGWYAAPVGWMDPWGNGVFAVAIRTGLFSNATATLFAGAGIVADSDPMNEWNETALKFKPLVEALGGTLPDE